MGLGFSDVQVSGPHLAFGLEGWASGFGVWGLWEPCRTLTTDVAKLQTDFRGSCSFCFVLGGCWVVTRRGVLHRATLVTRA